MNFAGTPVAYLFDEALFNDFGKLWKMRGWESAEVCSHCPTLPPALDAPSIRAPSVSREPGSRDLPTTRQFAVRSTAASSRPRPVASRTSHVGRRAGALPCR